MNSSKIILGTVQFGLNYGINNAKGKVSDKEIESILQYAQSIGIKTLDTAIGYGDAEEQIGHFHLTRNPFLIITKFDKTQVFNWEQSIKTSLEKLKIPIATTAMFHSFDSYLKSQAVIQEIVSKGRGKYFHTLGVSVYTNSELELLCEDENIQIVQVPFNLLDNERHRGEILNRLKERGKTIHVRSVFLQGLFYKSIHGLPLYLEPLAPYLSAIQQLAKEENVDIGTLAIQYVCSKNYIDGIILGVDNTTQLANNIEAANRSIDKNVFFEIDKINVENRELLNPSKWQL